MRFHLGQVYFAVLAISTRFGAIPAMWLSFGHTVGDIIYVTVAMLALSALAEIISNSMLYVKFFWSLLFGIYWLSAVAFKRCKL